MKTRNHLAPLREKRIYQEIVTERMRLEWEVKSTGNHTTQEEHEKLLNDIVEVENKERLVGL